MTAFFTLSSGSKSSPNYRDENEVTMIHHTVIVKKRTNLYHLLE